MSFVLTRVRKLDFADGSATSRSWKGFLRIVELLNQKMAFEVGLKLATYPVFCF